MLPEDKTILVKQALYRFINFCMDLPPKRFLSFPKKSTQSGELIHVLKSSPIVHISGKNYRVHMYMTYYIEEITTPQDIEE